MDCTVCHPRECSDLELGEFIQLVQEGGEVQAQGLRARIQNSESLVFIRESGELAGIAALKNPNPAYRSRVFDKASSDRRPDTYRFELGYVYVATQHRRKGLSHRLTAAALEASGDAAVFATSRVENVAMHRALSRCGFVEHGDDYQSNRGSHLRLFILDRAS